MMTALSISFDKEGFIYKTTYMSTKTIAVDMRVYERLASLKDESESFSKVIDRLVKQRGDAHTGAAILASLENRSISSLNDEEAAKMRQIIERDRLLEKWEKHDLS